MQYLPSSGAHINENAKFDPSSKIFEVTGELHSVMRVPTLCLLHVDSMFDSSWPHHSQISKKWKLQSIEQQQKELEDKRKVREEAKERAKKAAGNGLELDLNV